MTPDRYFTVMKPKTDDRSGDEPDAWDLDAPPPRGGSGADIHGPAEGVRFAELPVRVAAILLDVALLAIMADVGLRVATWILQSSFVRPGQAPADASVVLIALAIPLLLILGGQLGVIVLFLRRFRATPGQMAFGLFTLARGTGLRLSRGGAFTRWLVVYAPVAAFLSGSFIVATIKQISVVAKNPVDSTGALDTFVLFAPLVWGLVIVLTILADRRGRGIHDRLTGSVVVRREGSPN